MDAIYVPDDEIGYAALHVHSAVGGEKVSSAMQIAGAVRECITIIEKDLGRKINVKTLSYNRLMTSIKYMAARALTGETLKLDIKFICPAGVPEKHMRLLLWYAAIWEDS